MVILPVEYKIDKAAATLYASPDPGLFIHSFCAGLTDSNPLVQRGFLELLVKNVPLSLSMLQKLSRNEFLLIN